MTKSNCRFENKIVVKCKTDNKVAQISNICICTDISLKERNGAVDRITNLAKSASQQGTNVYLIDRAINKSLSSLFKDADKYYEFRNGVVKEHNFPLSITLLFAGLTKLIQEIFNRGISIFTFSFSPAVCLSYVFDPYLLVKLLFVCQRERIELLQSEFHITVPTSFIAKKFLDIPLIYDAHNVEAEIIGNIANISGAYVAATKLVEKTGCLVCDFIFVVSERDKEKFVSWGIPKEKIEIIPNSVNINRYSHATNGVEVRRKYGISDEIVLIFHGPLGYPPNKEAATILSEEVLPSILKVYPDVCLLLVGKDPPKISHPNIIVTGFVEHLPDYIAAADIAVIPILKGGGTRIKIVEYMASGKAIVSTFKGAEGLNLENGTDVFLTETPDFNFVNLILKLIEDYPLRNRMGINAQKKAELLYDWGKTAKKAVDIYSKLVYAS